MPCYEYRCNHCGNEYEIVCSIKDREDTEIVYCQECGSADVTRLMSAGSFTIDGKMSVSHPNSPEGQARVKEAKKKYMKKGKKAFDEWRAETRERTRVDKQWSYPD